MFDKCLFVLRNLSSLVERLCALRSRVVDRFLKSFRDWYSVMSTQLKKGREEDPKEELEKGLQEGFETGRKEEC